MTTLETFIDSSEQKVAEGFLQNGYYINAVDDVAALDSLRHELVKIVCGHLGLDLPKDDGAFLNTIHQTVPVEKVNDLRLAAFNQMNATAWFRPTYYRLARTALSQLVGNELAMQNKVNFSVQMPRDQTSTLGIHADTWSAETPFQVVVWLPLVDVYETKSMYILRPEINRTVAPRFKEVCANGGSAKLFDEYKKDFVWLPIKYGQVMLFSPILLHGNVVNSTEETRWSCNCRFTGLFTPYTSDEKRLGSFYLPITTKVVSRIGINYREPGGFDE